MAGPPFEKVGAVTHFQVVETDEAVIAAVKLILAEGGLDP